MTRFIMPIVLIGIAVAVFFMFAQPIYNDISNLKAQVASYDNALNNSKELGNERDALTAKYNAIDPNNLTKLQTLLPDNVNNIRLILEIQQLAMPYGMTLTNVKYDTTSTGVADSSSGVITEQGTAQAPADYGTFNLEFSTSGTYDNFISFTKDLENNLRIVDISSVDFSSAIAPVVTPNSKTPAPEIYTYDFKIQTYWLKS